MQSPSRRTLLTAGTLAVAALLAGCTGGARPAPAPPVRADPDQPLRMRAVAASDALLERYAAVLAGPAGADPRLRPLRDETLRQRAALAAGLPGGGSPSPSASHPPRPSGSPTGAPAPAPTLAALATAERTTAQDRLADLTAASPGLARLLASVSAAGARHAVLLGDRTALVVPPLAANTAAIVPGATASPSPVRAAPTTASTGGTAALQAALAAEHAAVYGYGVIGAKVPPTGPAHDQAWADYTTHQARRDAWQRLLSAAGATPVQAAPGYQLPFAVTDAADAARLGAELETRLTAVYADLVAGSSGAVRLSAAAALRECVLTAQQWGTTSGPLPGLPETADSGPPTASAGPSGPA
ncbi:ferritin-like domain-containing protein [Kitasatospora sp. NPDC052896]|uniref:ferritin-like domain-containing protein n=1 Tax=Kitasatospora sp. NPDC052896 TaxID=3364061 RepID=UPI0037C896FF